MKISYRWLTEYVKIDLPLTELAEMLTQIGLEVEHIESWQSAADRFADLVVGEVMDVAPHPAADKLRVAQVHIGAEQPLQIICGAPNLAVGQKVVVAPSGAKLVPHNKPSVVVEKKLIRGVMSEGMICAEEEIGIGIRHDGILVLSDQAQVGAAAAAYLPEQTDHILDIAVTPNRGDALSHIGVARDIAAYQAVHLASESVVHTPSVDAFAAHPEVVCPSVSIKNEEDCLRYTGLLLKDVTIGDSPLWLQQRLLRIGVKPINCVVDVTNFVMWECGQPLHAFDARIIGSGPVIVGNQPAGTSFETLDGQQLILHGEDLIIGTPTDNLCLAGVYGGKRAAVTHATTDVFLESACFRPQTIRRTSLRHQLRTDAALHFEKGTDPHACLWALQRAALLIQELCGGYASPIVDVYPQPQPLKTIRMIWSHLDRVAGNPINRTRALRILAALGFQLIRSDEDQIEVQPPSYRPDISIAEDLMEEIIRIEGMQAMTPATHIRLAVQSHTQSTLENWKQKVAELLVANGCYEIITNSVVSSRPALALSGMTEEQLVVLKGSANAGLDSMRTHMLFNGLEVIAYHLNRQFLSVQLFEFGKTYRRQPDGTIHEPEHLAIWLCGLRTPHVWSMPPRDISFFTIKGYVEALMQRLSLRQVLYRAHHDALLEGLSVYSAGEKVGIIGQIKPTILEQSGIEKPVFYADLLFEVLARQAAQNEIQYQAPARFPQVRRDLSLLLDRSASFADLEQLVYAAAPDLLKQVILFDVFEDKRLGEGKKSYAVSFILQHEQRTLTDSEIDQAMLRIMDVLEKEMGAVIRQ